MKKTLFAVLLLISSLFLFSCGKDVKGKAQVESYGEDTPETNKSGFDFDEKELRDERLALGISPDTIKIVCEQSAGKYYYDHISKPQQELYAEIYLLLKNHGEDVLVDAPDEASIGSVFLCVLNDHPEIYYTEGYGYRKYTVGGKIFFTMSGKYIYSKDECAFYDQKLEEATRAYLSGFTKYDNEYTRVKSVYTKVIKQTKYDREARDNQNLLSVLLYGKSVCQGYAKAVQYLLNNLGVECTVVTGKSKGGEGHAWNLVKIDGDYYYLDATWGDEEYRELSGEKKVPGREVSYDFLNVTSDDIAGTHTADNVVSMPVCTSREANYYVKEGLYFDSYNERELAVALKMAVMGNQGYLALKCSDRDVYQLYLDTLVTNKRIFELLPKGSSIASIDYIVNNEQHIICFLF